MGLRDHRHQEVDGIQKIWETHSRWRAPKFFFKKRSEAFLDSQTAATGSLPDQQATRKTAGRVVTRRRDMFREQLQNSSRTSGRAMRANCHAGHVSDRWNPPCIGRT